MGEHSWKRDHFEDLEGYGSIEINARDRSSKNETWTELEQGPAKWLHVETY
jgi:hypothetical protein